MPRYEEGYCLDDNARALLLATRLERAGLDDLASRYLAFVNHAFDARLGRFRNFMGYGRHWLEPVGPEDSHGRAAWALGATAAGSREPGRRALAETLFLAALPAALDFPNPRPWAYTLLGTSAYLAARPGTPGWSRWPWSWRSGCTAGSSGPATRRPWCEDRLTYCNARLPQALVLAGGRPPAGLGRPPGWGPGLAGPDQTDA